MVDANTGFQERIPEFIIFTGPMFGSKTTQLMAVVDRFRRQGRNVAAFKPMMDERYSTASIATHSGGKIPAISVSTGIEIEKIIHDKNLGEIDVIAVDEAFMIDGISQSLIGLFRKGITVVVSSLQLSASGNVFDEIMFMMPWATKIHVCPAVCPVSGLDAYYTHRKFDSMEEIVVGGSELYEPRSWFNHPYMNQRDQDGKC